MSLTPEEQVEMEGLQAQAPSQAAGQTGESTAANGAAQFIQKNLQDAQAIQKESQKNGAGGATAEFSTPSYGDQMLQSLEAGWQTSVTALGVTRGKLPDVPPVEHADMAMQLAQGIGQFAGDVPAMAAAMMAASPAGPGAVNAAVWGAPAALRQYYIDGLQKGEVTDFGDFWTRVMSASYAGIKASIVGAFSAGAGNIVGELGAGAITRSVSEIAAMTTMGKAMEDQMPKPSDFIVNAAMIGTFHGLEALTTPVGKELSNKLQDIYAATGIKPQDVAIEAQRNPVLQQELLEDNKQIPASLRNQTQPPPPNAEMLQKPEMVDPKIPAVLDEKSPVLSSDASFDVPRTAQVEKSESPEEKEPVEPENSAFNDFGKTPEEIIASRVGERGKIVKPESFDSQYAHIVDALDPINKLQDAISNGAELHPTEDSYVLLSQSKAKGYERARMAVETGPVDFETGLPTGEKSLKEILEPFKDDPMSFRYYWLARRTLEVANRGIETVIPKEAAEAYVTANKEQYEQGFREVRQWEDDGLKTLVESGIKNQEQVDSFLKDNQQHVPMNAYSTEGAQGGGNRYSLNPIRALKGNENLLLVDPLESMIKNRYAYEKQAQENIAKQALIDLADKHDAGELVSKEPIQTKPVKISDVELATELRKQGIEISDNDVSEATFWRPVNGPLYDNQIALMNEGEREVYNLDPSVAAAFKATGYSAPDNMLLKIPSALAAVERAGITLDPFFLLKHAIRDQFIAVTNSSNGYRIGWDGLRGLGHQLFDTPEWNEYLANGGGMSTMMDFKKDYIDKDIWALSNETGLIDKAQNVIRTPYDRMEMIAKMVFYSPKMGEYLRAIEGGKDVATAVTEARNVTPDVSRMGSAAWIKAWSAATPFASMRIRGLDQMYRSFTDNPAAFSAKMALGITLPTIANWWLNKDDPRYQDAPQWQKDLFWVVPIGGDSKTGQGGFTLRVPKPFEPGLLFGSLVERTMDAFYSKNPKAFNNFGGALVGGAIPNVLGPSTLPFIEHFANKSWLTGGNIIPDKKVGAAPDSQYTNYTSETAKAIGNIIGYVPGLKDLGPRGVPLASPAIVENYVRAWSGTLGMYALQLIDKGLNAGKNIPPQPIATLADIPFVKEFITRYPSMGSQPVQDFYDNYAKTQEITKTISNYKGENNLSKLNEFMNRPDTQQNMLSLQSTERSLSNMNAAVQGITRNPEMSSNDKRQLIDKIYFQIIGAAKQGNAIFEKMHQNMNTNHVEGQ